MKEQWFIYQSKLLLKYMEENPEVLLDLILKKEASSILEIPDKFLKKKFKLNREQLLFDRELFWKKEFKQNPQAVLDALMLMIREQLKENTDFGNYRFVLEESLH